MCPSRWFPAGLQLHSRRVIDKLPREAILLDQQINQRTHPVGFCKVMASIKNIQPQFLRLRVTPVWTLSGEKGIYPRFPDGSHFRSTAPCDHTYHSRFLRTRATHMGWATQDPGNPLRQIIERTREFSTHTQQRAFPLKKWLGILQPKSRSKTRVISQHRMNIQWDVRTVDGHARIHRNLEFLISRTGNSPGTAPEHAMMNDKKVYPRVNSLSDNRQRGINSRCHPLYLLAALHLQSVQGTWIVGNLSDLKFAIHEGNDLIKGSHAQLSLFQGG